MNAIEIQIEIERLEEIQFSQWLILKEEWQDTKSSISIDSFGQRIIGKLLVTKPSKDNFFPNFLGLTMGYIINKIYPKKPSGILAKVSKLSLEYLVSKFIANHSYQLIGFGSSIIKSFIESKFNSYEKKNK